ncbi:MAG: symmetrical bis(5'-nucleosyl)-tetraphosphatase [Steroidobacteraceae bacterium]
MARYAIGDLQGCLGALRALLQKIRFKADRDQLLFVGDLVNRGRESLECLRFVHALGENAIVLLGNHDLHLLAVALAGERQRRRDTLSPVLEAPDRDALLQWLLQQRLAWRDRNKDLLCVHAGVAPQWSAAETDRLARECMQALRASPAAFLKSMYGDQPDLWRSELTGVRRRRFVINALTRIRYCTPDGRLRLREKMSPAAAPPGLVPWFRLPRRRTRNVTVVFGHWSTLGLYRNDGVVGLDSGCVWGGALSAVDLDELGSSWRVRCSASQLPGAD